ncbi:MAG TPA: polysaccharide pyruvyl transferase family protein [Verrucomicrobiae bacterium]
MKVQTDLKGAGGKGKTIYFFGHFGSANFGNEITFQAVHCHVRRRLPNARLACVCTNPTVLAATQGIESIPISRDFGAPGKPRAGLARLLRRIFIGAPREALRWIDAFKTLRGVDMLVVPGTGLLTDAYGLQGWGPYSLFKWSLIARVRRCRLLFLSVGAGPLYGVLGTYFVKSALLMADFRSYRDDASMNCLKENGFSTNGDRVYPDLVFSLPETVIPCTRNAGRRRRVVGLGLMTYAGKYSSAEPDSAIYRQYLETLVSFVQWLLENNYDIRLFLGESTDSNVLDEFKSLLTSTVGAYDEERVIDEPVHSVEQLLPQIAATDIVVATRFHNVLLSLLLDKPVLAISFHRKCDSLMSQMGLAKYCHDINHMDTAMLIGQFLDLEKNAEQLKTTVRQRIEQSRKALDEQYDLVFSSN